MVNCGKYKLYLITNQNNKVQHLVGTHECKADTKGRIMMPIAIKKQLAAKMADGFVLKRAVFNTCLELYPLKD